MLWLLVVTLMDLVVLNPNGCSSLPPFQASMCNGFASGCSSQANTGSCSAIGGYIPVCLWSGPADSLLVPGDSSDDRLNKITFIMGAIGIHRWRCRRCLDNQSSKNVRKYTIRGYNLKFFLEPCFFFRIS